MPAPTPEPETAPEPDEESYVIRSEADLAMVLRDRGLEGLMSDIAKWGAQRGYPPRDETGTLMLDQPYEQYDIATLRGLAENGDMWAQQFLAQRLEDSRPAEASEWYRRAAASGSVFAMTQLGLLYNRIASHRGGGREFEATDDYLSQVYALKDGAVDPAVSGYAWVAAAEMTGWDPVLGGIASPVLRRQMDDDQVQEACAMAQGLRDDLMAQRERMGLGAYDRTPPPLVIDDAAAGTDCKMPESGGYDLSGCRKVTIEAGNDSSSVWLCNE